jgi:hypothetical protein
MKDGLIQLAQSTEPATGTTPPADAQPTAPPPEGVTVETLSTVATDTLSFFQTWLNKIGITSTATGLAVGFDPVCRHPGRVCCCT